jgi:hypothetical protein
MPKGDAMAASHAVAVAAALLLAVPVRASADDLTPTAQCVEQKEYKYYGYGGIAYTTGSRVPVLLTLTCTLYNTFEYSESWQSAPAMVVVAAGAANFLNAREVSLCTDAVADYGGGVTRSVHHCHLVETPV